MLRVKMNVLFVHQKIGMNFFIYHMTTIKLSHNKGNAQRL